MPKAAGAKTKAKSLIVGQPNIPMPTILWVILILLLLGALPIYPYSTSWGYYPSGGLGFVAGGGFGVGVGEKVSWGRGRIGFKASMLGRVSEGDLG